MTIGLAATEARMVGETKAKLDLLAAQIGSRATLSILATCPSRNGAAAP